mgnify:CR=1 FL=1
MPFSSPEWCLPVMNCLEPAVTHIPLDSFTVFDGMRLTKIAGFPLNNILAVAYLVCPFSSPLCWRPTITLLSEASNPEPDDSLNQEDQTISDVVIAQSTVAPFMSIAERELYSY